MTHDPTLDDVLGRLADGETIDWDEVERLASPSERPLIKQLRILQGVGETHRSTPVEASDTGLPAALSTATREPLLAPELEGPRRWGRYHLVRHIGRGSYGAVYLAHDEDLKRDIAIKLLHKALALRPDYADRVKAEGRALARIHHSNVLTVYDVEEHEQQLGLCMEYIDGRTLDDLVRASGSLNADEAVVIGQAICRGLAAVHAAGVLHRDIKARNVMRERAGRIVLMDLGSGLNESEGREIDLHNVGTPLYMAPELIRGGAATRQSDVYAVGVLLYYLVTAAHPVGGATIDELRRAHREGRRTPLDERRPDLPDMFVRAVERALAPDAADRPASAVSLLRELNRAAEATSGLQGRELVEAIGETHRPAAVSDALSWVRMAGAVALTIAALALTSGLLTTWTLNAVLDRPASFAPVRLASVFVLGLQTLLLPAVIMGAALGAGAILTLLSKFIPGPKQLWARGWHALLSRSGLREDEYVGAVAQIAILIGFAAVVLVWFTFRHIVGAFVSSISTSDLSVFAPFADNREALTQRVWYRMSVPALLLLVMVGWARVRRVRLMRGGSVSPWIRAAGVSLIALLMVLSQAPYQLMLNNKLPVVLVDAARCYQLGQQGTDVRVFCASWPVPRVRTVTTTHSRIEPCRFEESVFLLKTGTSCLAPSP